MSSVNPLNQPHTPATGIGAGGPQAGKAPALDSDAFMKMLMVQLRYQDPTKPMDSTNMVSQLADLTTVTGMSGLQKSVDGLNSKFTSSQSLYASTLVGKEVMVLADVIDINAGESVQGQILLPFPADDLNIKVYDDSNKLVATLPLNKQSKKGEVPFNLADLKNPLAPGKYHMKAQAKVDGKEVEVAITQKTSVTGVVIPGPNQAALMEVNKIGLVPLANITKIHGAIHPGKVQTASAMSAEGEASSQGYQWQGSDQQLEMEINSWFNRELLRQYPGLDGSGLVDTDAAAAAVQATPVGQAALALARKL